MFDKFHLTFNSKCKVSCDISKIKSECYMTSPFSSKRSPQCHMPSSACHFNFWHARWCLVFFLQNSHYMSNSELCVSIDMLFVWCKFLRVKCQKLAKHLPKIHTGHKWNDEEAELRETTLYHTTNVNNAHFWPGWSHDYIHKQITDMVVDQRIAKSYDGSFFLTYWRFNSTTSYCNCTI